MENTSIIHHVSIGSKDIEKSAAFYDAVLATVSVERVADYENAIAYGKELPEFWVQTPFDGMAVNVGNGSHVAFVAASMEQVQKFYREALKAGGRCDGPPGPREGYPPQYFGCFVRDLDGHKIEAVYWAAAAALNY